MKKVHDMKKTAKAQPAKLKFASFFQPFLTQAISALGAASVKPTLAYKITQIGAAVEAEYDRFNKLHAKIVQKYGKKDEKGELLVAEGKAQIPTESMQAANAEFTELSEIEFTVPVRLALTELDTEGVRLSGAQLMALGEIINPEA
jgi:hypothetical protein